MENRNLKGEIYHTLLVLQTMHDHLENWEIFPEQLKEEGKQTVRDLTNWTVEDKEVTSYIEELKGLVMLQLRCNKKLEERRESLWEADKEKIVSHGVFTESI